MQLLATDRGHNLFSVRFLGSLTKNVMFHGEKIDIFHLFCRFSSCENGKINDELIKIFMLQE